MPFSVSGPHGTTSPATQGQFPLGMPSQFESSPATAHESVKAGPTEPVQAPQSLLVLFPPSTQACCPATQGPRPSRPGCSSQGNRLPGAQTQMPSNVLSACPSQSLSSFEVQSRALGTMPPMQGPQTPAEQVLTPNSQMPASVAGPHGARSPSVHASARFGSTTPDVLPPLIPLLAPALPATVSAPGIISGAIVSGEGASATPTARSSTAQPPSASEHPSRIACSRERAG